MEEDGKASGQKNQIFNNNGAYILQQSTVRVARANDECGLTLLSASPS